MRGKKKKITIFIIRGSGKSCAKFIFAEKVHFQKMAIFKDLWQFDTPVLQFPWIEKIITMKNFYYIFIGIVMK